MVMKTKWLKEMSGRKRKGQFFFSSCGGFGGEECVKRSGSDGRERGKEDLICTWGRKVKRLKMQQNYIQRERK